MDAAFIKERITATKALIVAYEDALLAITTGGVESYTLDTGQSRQTVTKLDVAKLNKSLDTLYNRCTTLEALLTGSGSTTLRPAW
jgi:hypothetical protein